MNEAHVDLAEKMFYLIALYNRVAHSKALMATDLEVLGDNGISA